MYIHYLASSPLEPRNPIALTGRSLTEVRLQRVRVHGGRRHQGGRGFEESSRGLNSTFGFVGLQNVYAVRTAVAREILREWGQWRIGPPPLP